MHIQDALARYATQLAANGRSSHTLAQVTRHIVLFEHWLVQEDRPCTVGEIDHEDIACFLASDTVRLRADGEPRKASSANALRSSLRAFFRFLHDADFVRRDPARLVQRARVGPRIPRGMSEVEEAKLRGALGQAVTHAEKRDRALFELMLTTGLRVGSAVALRIEDCEFESGELRVTTMKGGRELLVYASVEVGELLTELIGERRRGWVFQGQAKSPLTPRHVQRRLQLWLERAGVRRAFSPHALRHTFATRLYRETRDLLLVQESLGHASVLSTTVYATAQRRPQ